MAEGTVLCDEILAAVWQNERINVPCVLFAFRIWEGPEGL